MDIGSGSALTWALAESLGARTVLWHPVDMWLQAGRLDADVLRALTRTTSAESLDTLWRCLWVQQLTRWSYAATLDAISDSIALRCFTRIGWSPPPDGRWLRMFNQMNRLALREVWKYLAHVRLRDPRPARRPREAERLLDQWARSVSQQDDDD